MSRSPFDPTVDQLPPALPVFPLSGVLLLPGGKLPLNVFEPRYLSMTRDALRSDGLIGMVQPLDGLAEAPVPELYRLGCVGRITSWSETDDGRYLVTLSGLCRFDLGEELPERNGYRVFAADYAPYRRDFEDAPEGVVDRKRLMAALRVYFKLQNIDADWKSIEGSSDDRLITTLAMVCPFAASEKQALLECPDLTERGRVIIALFEMAALGRSGGEARH